MTEPEMQDPMTSELVNLAEGLAPMFEAAAGFMSRAKALGLNENDVSTCGKEFILFCLKSQTK